jgi:uncharacterized membrane protein YcaP (DUF421 family)
MESLGINFKDLFQLEGELLELIVRASILYLAILVLMRILPRRTGGELAIMDLIFVILIAEAVAPSFGEYRSLSDGLVVVATLMFWNYLINVASYYSPFVEKLVSASPIQIVKSGKLLRRNMRREYLTEEELMDQIRKEGIEDIQSVKSAFIEGDGKISIVRR